MKKTPLFEAHLKQNAVMVNFAGWQMPLHYGSPLQEHLTIRKDVGMFDISHMGIISVEGTGAQAFLEALLSNDVKKLTSGQAFYTCLLNERGGIRDDLIVYKLADNAFYLVVNAATTEKDFIWIQDHAKAFAVAVSQCDLGIIAIQGPHTFTLLKEVLREQYSLIKDLKPFHFVHKEHWLIARTGYTGETGVEILLAKKDLVPLWQKLEKAKVKPIGLAARDTLRLEAGLNLYGQDMDEAITPFECHLTSTVDWQDEKREFIGKKALLKQQNEGVQKQLVGLVLLGQGIPRHGMVCQVRRDGKEEEGIVTSGAFSPSLNCGIAMCRVPQGEYTQADIEIRGKRIPAKMITLPFIKRGKATFS